VGNDLERYITRKEVSMKMFQRKLINQVFINQELGFIIFFFNPKAPKEL